jgi:nucleoside-diphosphate-sugar epimerase
MRVFATRSDRATGRHLVPKLLAAGHEVIGGGTGIWSFIEITDAAADRSWSRH